MTEAPQKPLPQQTGAPIKIFKSSINLLQERDAQNIPEFGGTLNFGIPPNSSLLCQIDFPKEYPKNPLVLYNMMVNDDEFRCSHNLREITTKKAVIAIVNELTQARDITIMYKITQN